MSKAEFNPIKDIQQLIDSAVNGTGEDLDLSMAPPFVRGMDLTGLQFTQVGVGEFNMVWTIDPHLTHYDGMVQGGIVNVIADTGQSFAYATTSAGPETFSTAEFTTRFFRPMKTGNVIDVRSRVINRSRRLGVVETRFTQSGTDKLCAIVTGSWMVVDRDFGEAGIS
jgi:uncharacterized protein (TIGR00369 family)|tara:strand:+ start:966 stop:1466 length:501 start_codon:yes stop_codon:yes gene_type:complete